TEGQGEARRVCGVLTIRPKESRPENPFGLVLFQCAVLVLAAGGPGELYRDSVDPNGCFVSLGLARDAGIALVNLTESQFGIGTRREGFPWNLSGTYVQAIPHICSVDADGTEHHFLAGYYRTTQELASSIFRKGYQWPFHATRLLDFGSSLVDLAIWREGQSGRRVVMDFNRNPLPVPGDLPFSLDRLDDDVQAYLGHAGAGQALPIDRLRHMNPLAIELYRRYKVDIAAEPLEFAVNNQHMNGGIAVDVWGRSSLKGCYAVGEAAGTHGVTRPGGGAQYARQEFLTPAAAQIAASGKAATAPEAGDRTGAALDAAVAQIAGVLRSDSPLSVKAVRSAVQDRMSDRAGMICDPASVAGALAEARVLNAQIRARGIGYGRPAEAARAMQWRQMALASEAVLTALDHFIGAGGGSRGARAILDPAGPSLPQTAAGPLDAFRFRAERDADRESQIVVRAEGDSMTVATRPNRGLDEAARSFFERDWPYWLTGRIYDLDPDRG
ncbi:MAG: hypothetical protein JNK88_05110, partial [Mangrovicoccus sp.]|nr:hypothetical protein [Mangrovicoccus sp.]